jgi:ABC-type bacteriocin/lantibiotic exporter with double-glycine peptidase domain
MSQEAPNRPFRRFFKLLQPDRKDIGYIYLFAVFNGLVNLSLPLGIQAIISLIMGGQVSTSWILLVSVVILGVVAAGILQILQLSIAEIIQQRIFTRAAFEFTYRIPRFKTESMLDSHPPELINRFFDTLTLQKGVPKLLMDFSTAAIQILFGLIVLSFYHPLFILMGLLLLLILIGIFYITSRKGLETSLESSLYKYEVAHWLEEIARVLDTLKLAGNTKLPFAKTDRLVEKYLKYRKEHFRVLVSQYGYMIGFKTLITGALLLIGGFLVIDRQINIGQFIAAEIIIILILNSVEKFILSIDTVYEVFTGLEKLGQVTDLPLETHTGEKFEDIDTGKGMEIELKNLTYIYPECRIASLKSINLKIRQGEKIGIIGGNDSGKSTLIQTIAGLFENFDGSITYNGLPIGNLNLPSLRHFIGDNLAQEDLFDGTLAENISLGRPEIGLTELKWAVHHAGLDDYLASLEKGFDTEIIPTGRRLSRSIIKRILFARSICSKPRLLLLDDFLSAVEKRTQNEMIDFLKTQSDWTLVVVTTRSAMLEICDRVVYLENGSIAAEGSPKEMLNDPKFQMCLNV